jgi:hypothetical protein
LYSSPKSFARRKKLTGDCKVSKSAQVLGLPFEESFEPKPECWVGRCPSCPKFTQKISFCLTQTVDFVAWPPKTQPKSPMTGEGQHEVPLVQGNLASQLKINTIKAFWPHKDNGFCGLAAQNTAKSTLDWLKANLKDHWPKEIWPPSSKV